MEQVVQSELYTPPFEPGSTSVLPSQLILVKMCFFLKQMWKKEQISIPHAQPTLSPMNSPPHPALTGRAALMIYHCILCSSIKTCQVGGDEDADEGPETQGGNARLHVLVWRGAPTPPGNAATAALLPFNNSSAPLLTSENRYAGVGATTTEAGRIRPPANWNRTNDNNIQMRSTFSQSSMFTACFAAFRRAFVALKQKRSPIKRDSIRSSGEDGYNSAGCQRWQHG